MSTIVLQPGAEQRCERPVIVTSVAGVLSRSYTMNLVDRVRFALGIEDIFSRLSTLQARPSPQPWPPPPPPPPAFVAVLVLAEGPDGVLVTMGRGHELAGDACSIRIDTHLPLRNAQILVFCDLARVAVEGIFRGPDLVHANLGECPIAKLGEWTPGVALHVNVRLREQVRSGPWRRDR